MKTKKRKFTLNREQFAATLETVDFALQYRKELVEAAVSPTYTEQEKADMAELRKDVRSLRCLRAELRSML